MRHRLLSAAVVVLSLSPAIARADDETHQCVAASEAGQKQRDDGHLELARDELLRCARETCPGPIRVDCSRWLVEVEARRSTVVFAAHDPRGGDLTRVRVLVDGAPLPEGTPGRAVAIDPGPHAFRFEAPGSAPASLSIVVHEGEKSRIVSVELTPVIAPSIPTTRRPFPVAAAALGAVGVAGIAAFAIVGSIGEGEKNELARNCAGSSSCSSSSVDGARDKLIIADVSLGIGIVAIATASYLLFRHETTTPAPAKTALDWGIVPTTSGAMVGVGGCF